MEEKKQQNPDTQAEEARQKEREERIKAAMQKARQTAIDVEFAVRASENVKARKNTELEKKIVALLVDDDYSSYYVMERKITGEKLEALRKEVETTEGGLTLYNSLNGEWNGLREYAYFIKTSCVFPYLLQVADLYKLIAEYNHFSSDIQHYNTLYHYITTLLDTKQVEAYNKATREAHTTPFDLLFKQIDEETYRRNKTAIDKLIPLTPEKKGFELSQILTFDPDREEPFKMKVKYEKALYGTIKKVAKALEQTQGEIKGCMEAVFEYLQQSDIGTLPIYFEETLTQLVNNTLERFRYIEDEKYYAGFLNDKIEKGYQPTEEEKKWAIIPDYKRTTTNKAAYNYGKKKLYSMLLDVLRK